MSLAARLQGRLDRLELAPDHAARAAGLPVDLLVRLLRDEAPLPRGQRLVRLAEVLETSVAYLIGLDPDAPVPAEYLEDDQGELGLLARDEVALLRGYRRLDIASGAAILRVMLKMAPEAEEPERRPVRLSTRR